jgi:hypothetical protein
MGGDLGVFPEPLHYRHREDIKKVGFSCGAAEGEPSGLLDVPRIDNHVAVPSFRSPLFPLHPPR